MDDKFWTKKEIDELTYQVIGCAIEVHKFFGPGLLEENYEDCFATELELEGLKFERQKELDVVYKNRVMQRRYRLDLLVEEILVVELKAIKDLLPIHKAQVLTYLKLANKPKGLLINFHTKFLRRGHSWFSLVNDSYRELPT